MDDELLILKAYVEISSYRFKTVKAIGGSFMTPTDIAKATGIRTNHISNVLKELREKNVVECINEEARKGRLYRLTDTKRTDINYWVGVNNVLNYIKEEMRK